MVKAACVRLRPLQVTGASSLDFMRDSVRMQRTLKAVTVGEFGWPSHLIVHPFDPRRHVEVARNLLNSAYANGQGSIDRPDIWWSNLTSDPEFDQELCFAVEDVQSGELLAFAQVWTTGFIKDFAVHSRTRQRGIGRALINHIFETLKHLHFKRGHIQRP